MTYQQFEVCSDCGRVLDLKESGYHEMDRMTFASRVKCQDCFERSLTRVKKEREHGEGE